MSSSAAPNQFAPPLHGIPPQQLNYAPLPQFARPMGKAALKRIRLGDRYFMFLCLVLLGYALGGRGFAYWGVNPLFVGEIMLLTGVAVMLRLKMLGRLLSQRFFIPLMIFMAWGVCRTVPFLDMYQKDAIRDAVFWGYGTFAFIVAGLLMQNPLRVQKIVVYGRKFVILFLCLAPISAIACSFFEASIPNLPGQDVPVIQVKGGDLCVHLAGCYSFIVALGKGINPLIYLVMLPLNLGLNIQGRAGMVAFALAVGVAGILRPFHARAMRIWFVIAVGLFALWASDLRVEKGARELSFRGLVKGITSIVVETGDEAVDGSKKWRQDWWAKIIDYTIYGQYFWTGKGFGVNLAHEDGFDTDADMTLRSPHNGHMTVLARMGVPGVVIWVTVQLGWATMIVRAYFRARKRKHMNWSGLFMFLGSYWAAFMANAAFDVFLEGPMGGIWMWCLYGAGVGCVWVYKRYPDLLTSPEMLAKQQAGRGFEVQPQVPVVTTIR